MKFIACIGVVVMCATGAKGQVQFFDSLESWAAAHGAPTTVFQVSQSSVVLANEVVSAPSCPGSPQLSDRFLTFDRSVTGLPASFQYEAASGYVPCYLCSVDHIGACGSTEHDWWIRFNGVEDVFAVAIGGMSGTTNQYVARIEGESGGLGSFAFTSPNASFLGIVSSDPITVVFMDDDSTSGGVSFGSIFFAMDEPPASYCTGKTNSLGCVPFVSSTGVPSAASSLPFQIIGNDAVPSEIGFVLYSFKKSNLDFHGGKLCVKAPVVRLLPPKVPSNTGNPPCEGVLRRNFNTAIQSGNDPLLTAGQTVFAQWRQRDPADPAGFGDSLTDGLRFAISP